MNCEELQSRLLDIADGHMPSADAAAVREHMDQCPACRAEVDQSRAGAQALRAAAGVLAPQRRYLTAGRLEKLMVARVARRKPFKIITLRRLVAAAAAAAILAAVPFLVGDVKQILNPSEQEPPAVAQAPVQEWRGPVILAATGRADPMSVMRSASAASTSITASSPPERVGLAVSDTPGLRVPVENVLYDPDESSHWW